ncbi:hypothetical protein M8C21_019309, partial [Ambrosia artemisiifolia]
DIAGTLATEAAEDATQVAKLCSALESVDHMRRKDQLVAALPVDELIEKADDFAGVFPEHKYEIVKILQMDDATDAARGASDIVLTEHGLSVIISVVLTSRAIFQRMKNYIIYVVSITIRIGLRFMLLTSFYEFNFPPILILVIAILNDGTIMTISKDRVKPSPSPDSWKLSEIFATGIVIGTYLALIRLDHPNIIKLEGLITENVALTSRIVRLSYRPPELLLGSTCYGVAVDLWSTGCILGELANLLSSCIKYSSFVVRHLKIIVENQIYSTRQRSNLHSLIYRKCVGETFIDVPSVAIKLMENLLAIDPSLRGTAKSALETTSIVLSSRHPIPPLKYFKVFTNEAMLMKTTIFLQDEDHHRRSSDWGGGGGSRGSDLRVVIIVQ